MKNRLIVLLVLVIAGLVGTRPPAEREARAQGTGLLARSNAWNVSSVTSGGTVFVTSQTTSQAASAVRVTVVLGSTAPLAVVWSDASAHTFTCWLNGSTSLTANCAYTFVMGARNSAAPGGVTGPTAFNFVVGSATTVPLLWTEEVTGGVD